MLSLTYIYAHLEPDSDEIRYIGKADDPEKRLNQHLCDPEVNHRTNWVRALKRRGLVPRLEILCAVPTAEWQFWERYYIKHFRDCGFVLVNGSSGGEGFGSGAAHPMFGKPISSALRASIAASNRVRVVSMATRARMGAAQLGRKRVFSLEHCARIGAAQIGKTVSMESRRKQSVTMTGRKASLETRAKMSAAHTGKSRGPYKKVTV